MSEGLADTASSQGYAAAAGAESGGPFQDTASIYFGNAVIGPSSLTNTPTITPNASAQPSAAEGGSGVQTPTAGEPLGGGSLLGSSIWTDLIFVGVLLVAGALVVHMVKK